MTNEKQVQYSEMLSGADITDKFYLHDDGRIKWWYWNPNGYGEMGQFVEHCLDAAHVRAVGCLFDEKGNYDTERFFVELNNYGCQYLHDNDGSAVFCEIMKWFSDANNFHILSAMNEQQAMALLLQFSLLSEEQRRFLITALSQKPDSGS